MKHKITYYQTIKKKGFLGIPKTVKVKRTVWVDGKTYWKLVKQEKNRPLSFEEWMMYDKPIFYL